jgi:plasmid stabilization system protein ParE
MSSPIRITRIARDDLRSAARWYEDRQVGLGRAFLSEVRKTFDQIGERPTSFPVAHRDMRRAQLHRFPYGVFFVANPIRIDVLGVIDLRRNPDVWQSRR